MQKIKPIFIYLLWYKKYYKLKLNKIIYAKSDNNNNNKNKIRRKKCYNNNLYIHL